MEISDRTLLRLHVEAVWGVRLSASIDKDKGEDVALSPESAQPSWCLCAAHLAAGSVYIWRPDVLAGEREALRSRLNAVLLTSAHLAPPPEIHREVALSLTANPQLDAASARRIARPLTLAEHPLIEAFEPGSSDYFLHPTRQPLIGVVVSGQLLSVAHSSRRTPEACELGIETAASARRRGYALAATVVWTEDILREGLVPIYSADAANAASLRLAHAAGYRAFAQIATLTR